MEKTRKQVERDEQIYQISTLVAGNFELQDVLDRLAEAAVKVTGTQACSIRLLDDGDGDLKMRSTYGLSEAYRNKGPVTRDDPVIREAFEGHAVVLDDMRVDGRVHYREETIREGLISQLTVAMKFGDKPIGVLRLYSPEPNQFDEDAVTLARLVASQCAVAITNARLYSQALEGARVAEQMRLGAVIQRRMIPEKAPCVCGLDIAAVYEPCFEIGGDLYDYFMPNNHSIAIGIADVIGKGVPAAIMMSMFRGTIRAYADGGYERHSLEEIIRKLNNVACRECHDGEFITLFIGVIDTRHRTLRYCNCGHEPALLVRDRQIRELEEGGLVLGVLEEARYKISTIDLQEGDVLLMYTDGLIDAMNYEGQLWGKEQLLNVLQESCCMTAHCLVRNILQYRRRFVGLASQMDDTSLVAIRFDRNANNPETPVNQDRHCEL
ncbi:MAG: SpoIIE family protein phosphatase [Sedimentisphaerales bacterium]|nr:SpoIIE family protein phosphatase [Sedimentisphaerales bacterium]